MNDHDNRTIVATPTKETEDAGTPTSQDSLEIWSGSEKATVKNDVNSNENPPRPLWQKVVGVALVMIVVAGAVVVPITLTSSKLNFKGSVNNQEQINNGQDVDLFSTPMQSPSNSPSDIASSIPTDAPSTSPSESPSTSPSISPSTSPSTSPTSSPTSSPTNPPTKSYVEPNPVPINPGRGYFNYDINDKDYGPTRWDRVDTSSHPLREFGPNGFGPWDGHLPFDPEDNQCGRADRRQSPKNLVSTVECDAHHEIRTWCGQYGVMDDNYETQILPHKLSLVMNRRPCIDMDKDSCQSPRPPVADYPRYSSSITSYADLMNYDIKIPGEHTIEGESFDAEIQMLHIHPTGDRVSSIGVMVRVREDGYNAEFQKIINAFQNVYDAHAFECARRRKKRNLQFFLEDMDPLEDLDLLEFREQRQTNNKFNPYSDALMPTIFFYRYNGSITEPPCKDLTWWVMIDPMIISPGQLIQIQQILFTHVDEDCDPTSVHNADQSVARPLYQLGDDRDIQKCSRGTFISDLDKGRGEGKKCR